MRLALALLVTSSTAFAQLAQPQPQAPKWYPIDATLFTAEMPGIPNVKEGKEKANDTEVKMVTWGSAVNDVYYALAVAEYPPGVMQAGLPGKFLESSRDGAMAQVNATVEHDTMVFLDSGIPKKKYPGREFDGSTPAGLKVAARVFLVDDRLFQLIVVAKAKVFNAADFKRFADSFKLKKGGAEPPAKGGKK